MCILLFNTGATMKTDPGDDNLIVDGVLPADLAVEKRIDALEVLLLYCAGNTLLPELYRVFGKEYILRFLDLFAGTTLEVPSRETIEQSVRDVDIWIRLRETNTEEVRAYLAEKYHVSLETVREVFERVNPIMIVGGMVKRKKQNGTRRESKSAG